MVITMTQNSAWLLQWLKIKHFFYRLNILHWIKLNILHWILLQTHLRSNTTCFIENLQHDRDFRTKAHIQIILKILFKFWKSYKTSSTPTKYIQSEMHLLIRLYLHHLADALFTATSILTRLSYLEWVNNKLNKRHLLFSCSTIDSFWTPQDVFMEKPSL
jgi:hypothetical protein